MAARRDIFRGFTLGLAVLLLSLLSSRGMAEPVVENITPRGLQAGQTTTVRLAGQGLSAGLRVLLPVPIAKQDVQPDATAQDVTIAITLDAAVPAGIYPLRVVNHDGISAAVPVGIDALPQLPFAETVEQLPVALHGSVIGSNTARTTFQGKEGQSIVVDVEAQRIGSKLNPILLVYDRRGVQLAWSQAQSVIGGDARVDVVLPADGPYTVELRDALYRGGAPGFFRLKIGELHYADLVFPIAVTRATQTSLELLSTNIVPDARVAFKADGRATAMPVAWPKVEWITGSRPWLTISDENEMVETPSPGAANEVLGVPVGINGRISAEKEEDLYRLPVAPGADLRFEVIAGRAGSPLDAVLSIRSEEGEQLARNDDQGGVVDPALNFTVPSGHRTLILAIRDLTGRGGRDFIYRIAVTPVHRPGFQLRVGRDRFLLPRDGSVLLPIEVQRRGHNGAIRLKFADLPAGVTVRGDEIPAGVSRSLVSLTAEGTAAGEALVSAAAYAVDLMPPRTEPVRFGAGGRPYRQRWADTQVALAVVDPAPLSATWALGSGQTDEARSKLSVGMRSTAKVIVTRGTGVDGPVRLSLVTSQQVPRRKVRRNNKDIVIEDASRALRLEAAPTLVAGATDIDVAILVPAGLPKKPYDVALRAELLTADGQNVRATYVTSAERIEIVAPAPSQPLAVFEDELELAADLKEGKGILSMMLDDRYAGVASIRVAPEHRSNPNLPGLGAKIREYPAPGEYRYFRFAWKKQGGEAVCIQLAHDGRWGPDDENPAKFRYHAGPGKECFGASLLVDKNLPGEWTVVTRDLFADFGAFTLTGLGLAAVDGDFAAFDHVYLGRAPGDFELVKP